MDKYQKHFISLYSDGYNELFKCQLLNHNEKVKREYFSFDDKNDIITIKQDEDITKTQYEFTINGYGTMGEGYIILDKVEYYKNNRWIDIKNENNLFKVVVDFNDKIEKIKLNFVNSLVDDLVISIAYEESNKETYYAKKEQERKDNLLKIANIKVSTGADLVNIYFQPCCDDYVHTEITLYKDNMMLAKYKVGEDVFFKSINGLAYGKYEFILKQFDDKGNIILETDKISFSLSRPHYGGKPTIYI